MSWVRIWVHLVFSTKNRYPFLETKKERNAIFLHIKENAAEKGIYLDCVNGYIDHAHCLISLGKTQSISEVAHLIKGESSRWFNTQKFISGQFSWQNDYWAVSISEADVIGIRKYIHNQEEHHRSQSFIEEINEFVEEYGWRKIKG